MPPSCCLPARRAPLSLIFRNFHVIERYNQADAYVIAVGHLSGPDPGRFRFACQLAARRPLSEVLGKAGNAAAPDLAGPTPKA